MLNLFIGMFRICRPPLKIHLTSFKQVWSAFSNQEMFCRSGGQRVSKGHFHAIHYTKFITTGRDDVEPRTNAASSMSPAQFSRLRFSILADTISAQSPELSNWFINCLLTVTVIKRNMKVNVIGQKHIKKGESDTCRFVIDHEKRGTEIRLQSGK